MNVLAYVDKYLRIKHFKLSCSEETIHNLLKGDVKYSLTSQRPFGKFEDLALNIEESVKSHTRDKDMAISIYKDFCEFLKKEGIEIDITFSNNIGF